MKERIFIISDLHLGGAAGFQMTSADGRGRLQRFIHWAATQTDGVDRVRMIIAGDIVDFLAEKPFAEFSGDGSAKRKLERIFETTEPIWTELAGFASKHPLTLMIGNHDVELSMSGARTLLLDKLRHGRVDFVYDNQALSLGDVLVEHGNRYDSWNAVPHDTLRHVRSQASRRAGDAIDTLGIPGSALVVRVMNRLKAKYSFVDLLKPERSAMIPLLAVLEPTLVDELDEVVELYVAQRKNKRASDGTPLKPEQIGAKITARSTDEADVDETALALEDLATAHALAAGSGKISFTNVRALIDVWRASRKDGQARLPHLLSALQRLGRHNERELSIVAESEDYLVPARASIQRGYRIVVYGHTHLPKRIELEGGMYLNSGTWADVLTLPPEILEQDADRAVALKSLEGFLDALAADDLRGYRRQIPTFVEVESVDGHSTANIFHYTDDQPRTPLAQDAVFS